MNRFTSFCLFLAAIPLSAQVSGNYQYNQQQSAQSASRNPATNPVIVNNNEILIEVHGLMNILADNYVAVFNILQVAETPDNADQLMNNRIAQFKQELKKTGLDTGEITVDMLSFVPNYDIQTEKKLFSKTYNEVPAGFELQKNVSVRYRHSAQLDAIVTAAAAAEIYDLVKVDYFIPNVQKSLDTLRTKCLAEIKAKTKAYEAIGFKLDTLKKTMADQFTTVYPQTRYSGYQAFSRPSLNAARKKSGGQSNLNEAPKTTSRFYNPLSYEQYDLVVNPVVTEPVVQLSYSVSVKYFLKEEEKPKNVYYLITPGGDIRPFNPK